MELEKSFSTYEAFLLKHILKELITNYKKMGPLGWVNFLETRI